MTRTTTTRTKAVSDNAPSSSNADDAPLTRERDGGDGGAGMGEGAGTKSTPTTGGTEAAVATSGGGTDGRVRATTTDSAEVVRGTWEDVDGGDGGDGSSGDGGGSGGDGGDGGDSASGNGASTWLRTKTREMHGATEGGALFGALVAVAMNGVAWMFFSALKPSPAEREQYALETRRAETAAKERAKAERAARKEMEKAEKRRWMTAKPSSVLVPPKTAPVAEAVVEEAAEAIEGDGNGEAEASSAERAAVEDKASTSDDSSEDDSAVKIVSVQHRPSGTSASEDEAVGPETSSDVAEAESAFEDRVRACEGEQHRAEDGFLEKCHHDDEEYLPAHEEHPNYKIIRAVREANALMHDVHARRAEVNHEFAEALRYRKQVIHMAAEHGIPVAPLREIKETFDQEESPPLGVTAREKANQAARSAFSATKKFVHFATPHVQAASSKAFEFTKDTAGKATTAASERLKDVKAKQASGELRAPTMDEAVAAAKSTSRRALGAVIHAYDRIAGHVRELKP